MEYDVITATCGGPDPSPAALALARRVRAAAAAGWDVAGGVQMAAHGATWVFAQALTRQPSPATLPFPDRDRPRLAETG